MHEDCVDFTLISWSGVSGTGGCSRLADANVIRAIGSQNVKMADGRDQVRRVEQMLVTHDLGNGWPVQPDVVMVWSKSSGFSWSTHLPSQRLCDWGSVRQLWHSERWSKWMELDQWNNTSWKEKDYLMLSVKWQILGCNLDNVDVVDDELIWELFWWLFCVMIEIGLNIFLVLVGRWPGMVHPGSFPGGGPSHGT